MSAANRIRQYWEIMFPVIRLVLLLFVFVLFIISFSNPVRNLTTILVLGVPWLAYQIFVRSEFQIPRLLIGILLLLFAYQTTFLFRSVSQSVPITYIFLVRILFVIILVIYFFNSMATIPARKDWENVVILLAIFICLASISEIIQWNRQVASVKASLDEVVDFPKLSYRLGGSLLGHANSLAGFINLIWPIVFIRIIRSKGDKKILLWGLILLLYFFTLFFTSSRGGWLGTFAAFIMLLFMFVLEKLRTSTIKLSTSERWRIILISVVSVLSFIALLSLVFLRSQFTGTQVLGIRSRLPIWENSWQVILEEPIWGHGLGMFPIPYTKAAQLPPGFLAPEAHNLWLQVAAEIGLIGFVFLNIVLILLLIHILRTYIPALKAKQWSWFAYAAGFVGFTVHQFFDHLFIFPAFVIVFILILVLLVRYYPILPVWNLDRKQFEVVGIIVLLAFVFTGYLIKERVIDIAEYNVIQQLAKENEWEIVQLRICQVADEYPENALYQFECSLALAQTSITKESKFSFNDSLNFQKIGHEQNPWWPVQTANLAVLQWQTGHKKAAITGMKKVVSSAPRASIFALNLGWMQEATGDHTNAYLSYVQALRLAPWMRNSRFASRSNIFQEAALDLDYWQNSDELWPNSEDIITDPELWKGMYAYSKGDAEVAVQWLEISHSNFPGSYPRYAYLASAYQLSGEPKIAMNYASTAWLLSHSGGVKPSWLADYHIGNVFRSNGYMELAYQSLRRSFTSIRNYNTLSDYYYAIYGQTSFYTDISPLLIRDGDIQASSHDDWAWLANEAQRLGEPELSLQVWHWLESGAGISYQK